MWEKSAKIICGALDVRGSDAGAKSKDKNVK
jgi:hypothetical protein